MKTTNALGHAIAAVTAAAMSYLMVLAISTYAYPGMSAAPRVAFAKNVMPEAVPRLPANCKACAPG